MRIIHIAVLVCLVCRVGAQDEQLYIEIARWKRGDEPPHKLLHFPDGKIEQQAFVCGVAGYSDSVAPYLDKIEDDDLLAALIFDYRTERETFDQALLQLLRRKGPDRMATLLSEKRERKEERSSKSEINALRQILRSPFIRVKAALIETEDMPRERALECMSALKRNLGSGMSWKEAYGLLAEQNPDVARRKAEPRVPTTLVCYLYDSWISEIGFDLVTFRMAERIPIRHLPGLFEKGVGVYVVAAENGVYAYSIEQVYKPSSPAIR